MNKQWFKMFFDKRGTTLLTGAGIAFDISCAITTGRACVLANRIIEAKTEEYGRTLTPKEKVEETWQLFVVPGILGVAGGACHIGSTVKSHRKQAALMSVATATETAYERLKDEIPEVVGKNKADKIEESVVQKNAKEHQPSRDTDIINITKPESFGPRDTLMFDNMQGLWYRSNTEELLAIQNTLNAMLNDCRNDGGVSKDPVSLTEYNYELGIKPGELASRYVWPAEQDENISIKWTGCLEPYIHPDGTEEPYLIVRFDPEPVIWYTD